MCAQWVVLLLTALVAADEYKTLEVEEMGNATLSGVTPKSATEAKPELFTRENPLDTTSSEIAMEMDQHSNTTLQTLADSSAPATIGPASDSSSDPISILSPQRLLKTLP